MARRRKIEIPAKDLKCFNPLVEELKKHPAFADFDPKSIKISAYESYESIIKDVASAIRCLDRYEWINRDNIFTFNEKQIISKSDIAKALGISRPTVDKWIEAGFLDGCEVSLGPSVKSYQLPLIRQKLIEYRDKQKK